jgi:hypothetical protein
MTIMYVRTEAMKLGLSILLFCGGLLSVALHWCERRRRRSLLSAREILPIEGIYYAYYQDKGIGFDPFQVCWRKVATALHVNGGQLRPFDQLDEISGTVKWLAGSEDLSDLAYELDLKEARLPAPESVKSETINTVDDLLRRLVGLVT